MTAVEPIRNTQSKKVGERRLRMPPHDLPRRRRMDGLRIDDFGMRGSFPVSR